MPIFLICIIVFVIWFRVKMKKNDKKNDAQNESFWEREVQANFSRKKDISELTYLSVPESAFPLNASADEEEEYLIKEVLECSHRKMLNLSGYTNTDLKEKYGVVNLEELSNCDQNFTYFIRALNKWGDYLYKHDDFARAKQVMELSLSIGSDISNVFITLGNIYATEGNEAKIDDLIQQVEDSNIVLKDATIKKLKICKLEM